jgi:hypothetical protein
MSSKSATSQIISWQFMRTSESGEPHTLEKLANQVSQNSQNFEALYRFTD